MQVYLTTVASGSRVPNSCLTIMMAKVPLRALPQQFGLREEQQDILWNMAHFQRWALAEEAGCSLLLWGRYLTPQVLQDPTLNQDLTVCPLRAHCGPSFAHAPSCSLCSQPQGAMWMETHVGLGRWGHGLGTRKSMRLPRDRQPWMMVLGRLERHGQITGTGNSASPPCREAAA